MRLAGEEAGRLGQDYIGDEHVLLGLLRYGGGPAAALLAEAGATLAGARAELASMRARGLTPGPHPGSPQLLCLAPALSPRAPARPAAAGTLP
jgi:ATP-dependent Clp protease ATP-binding subunit ClpC